MGPALRSPCRVEDRMQDFRYALKSIWEIGEKAVLKLFAVQEVHTVWQPYSGGAGEHTTPCFACRTHWRVKSSDLMLLPDTLPAVF